MINTIETKKATSIDLRFCVAAPQGALKNLRLEKSVKGGMKGFPEEEQS